MLEILPRPHFPRPHPRPFPRHGGGRYYGGYYPTYQEPVIIEVERTAAPEPVYRIVHRMLQRGALVDERVFESVTYVGALRQFREHKRSMRPCAGCTEENVCYRRDNGRWVQLRCIVN